MCARARTSSRSRGLDQDDRTNSGGKIIGFGNSTNATSSHYDRHVYMQNDGKLTFGVYPDGVRTVTSPTGYNDGQWHQVVASLGSDGMQLYVDGQLVGADPERTSARELHRLLADRRRQPDRLDRRSLTSRTSGLIDDVAVYAAPLSRAARSRLAPR